MENLNYDLSMLFTYQLIEDKNLSQIAYQTQLLQVFKLDISNNNMQLQLQKMVNTTALLYKYLSKDKELVEIYDILLEKNPQFEILKSNKGHFFQMLLSYDYLYIFHKSLINYENNKSLEKPCFSELKQIISQS